MHPNSHYLHRTSRFGFLLTACTIGITVPSNASSPILQPHQALYRSLDPNHLAKQLAFYRLYPETPEGAKACARAAAILGFEAAMLSANPAIDQLVGLFSGRGAANPTLPTDMVQLIKRAGATLHNRRLVGHAVTTRNALSLLKADEIDIGRAVLLAQLGDEAIEEIERHEAVLDLMALQIKASTADNMEPRSLIKAINHFLFYEMGFRFPPHSTFSEQIDRYTFLPSVLDRRKGVCLGVSFLYLSLAQRLGLPLEIITPPGHIFLRYRDGNEVVNIETTARGIHLPTHAYLGVDTRSLQTRNLREAVGLAFVNQASVYWQALDYSQALLSYEKAAPFLSDDVLVTTLSAFCLLQTGHEQRAREMLTPLRDSLPDWSVSADTMIGDWLDGLADADAIEATFLYTDETDTSIRRKRERLEEAIERCPNFRAAWFQLASCWLQQYHSHEALKALDEAWKRGERGATTSYLLAVLHSQRRQMDRAWYFLRKSETAAANRGHRPRALLALRRELATLCPEPPLRDEEL